MMLTKKNSNSEIEIYGIETEKRIFNYGNYYVVPIYIVENNHCRAISVIYDKKGNVLLPADPKQVHLTCLDHSNFLVEISGEKKRIEHYRVDNQIEKIFEWDNIDSNGRKAHEIISSDWISKGIIAITHQGKEHLYSFKEGKILSYGFTSIDAYNHYNEADEINYTKNNCCKVTLTIKSNLLDEKSCLSETLVGYIGEDGLLKTPLLSLRTGNFIKQDSLKTNSDLITLEETIENELNNEVQNSINSQKKIEDNIQKLKKMIKL